MTPQTNYRYCSNCGKPLFLVKRKWYTILFMTIFTSSPLYTVAVLPPGAEYKPLLTTPYKMAPDLPTGAKLSSLQIFSEKCKRAGIEMPEKVKELFIKEYIDNG